MAVPVPFADSLTYRVPPELGDLVAAGLRVRVPVGRRRLAGVVLEVHDRRPELAELRDVEGVLDSEAVLPADLLALARFVAAYYLAPLGEVVRAILPADLPSWGSRRVWLTSGGALARPRSAEEASVIDALREAGRLSVAELQRATRLPALAPLLAQMEATGRIAFGDGRRARSSRFVSAVELASGDPAALIAACGRSPRAREVVVHLLEIGRPATVEELTTAVGCGPAVIRRLSELGVLKRFSQIERLGLAHHMLSQAAPPPLTLRRDQSEAQASVTAALAAGEPAAFLLAGVTGSGKTEVYLRAAETALARGSSVILLVPEIALVPALAASARLRFGGTLAILHSGLASAERHQEWERVRRGEARVVLGPRSAVLAPVARLGLVVVDEEQDAAYKQEVVPRYHGRDLALVRAQQAGAVALLVSATPSLESRYNVERGRLRALALTARAGQGKTPEGILVDLRREPVVRQPGEVVFSARLRAEIAATLESGEQSILLRNRRGYSPILLCRACGEDLRCEQCGLPRTFHRRERSMVCHYCGSRVAAPTRCPACSEPALEPIGAGTERVEERFQELFPEASVAVLDRDSLRRPGGAAGVLERFARGDAQVLIGTQMVSKGHHFPRVSLTAVLTADAYLGFPDFRAVEKTYTLLTQLAGRAGRGDVPGRVVIQTYHPDHYAIRAALAHDDAAFACEEMRFRRVFHYPPFTRMVQLLARDKNRERVESAVTELARRLADHHHAEGVRISGPAPAPLERLRNEWRYQILLRGPSGKRLRQMVADALSPRPTVEVAVDVDPYQLL